MGCGMVDPKVLELVELDPLEWSGYAFALVLNALLCFFMALMILGIFTITTFDSLINLTTVHENKY